MAKQKCFSGYRFLALSALLFFCFRRLVFRFFWGFVFFFAVLGLITFLAHNSNISNLKYDITVTNKRIIGQYAKYSRVDLPIHQITSVCIGVGNSLDIQSPSGTIRVYGLVNRELVCECISNLMNEYHEKITTAAAPIIQSKMQGATEELLELKKLLDSGILTQEEFDSKKKQLLDL